MTPQAFLVLAALADVPIFYGLFRVFWKDWRECAEDWFEPDIQKQENQAWFGEGYSDHLQFVGACVSVIVVEYVAFVFVLGGETSAQFEWVMDLIMIWLRP